MVEADEVLDTSGLSCPMPVLKAKKAMDSLAPGKVLKLIATDRGSRNDIPAWAKNNGYELLESGEENGKFIFYIKKPE
ncbi:MAG: sulfurtransferase TusA family protein [Euryarchaeota archaeon]|nr:sulfurtransferase TusA family protein [Euryarchaeota archaeon]